MLGCGRRRVRGFSRSVCHGTGFAVPGGLPQYYSLGNSFPPPSRSRSLTRSRPRRHRTPGKRAPAGPRKTPPLSNPRNARAFVHYYSDRSSEAPYGPGANPDSDGATSFTLQTPDRLLVTFLDRHRPDLDKFVVAMMSTPVASFAVPIAVMFMVPVSIIPVMVPVVLIRHGWERSANE